MLLNWLTRTGRQVDEGIRAANKQVMARRAPRQDAAIEAVRAFLHQVSFAGVSTSSQSLVLSAQQAVEQLAVVSTERTERAAAEVVQLLEDVQHGRAAAADLENAWAALRNSMRQDLKPRAWLDKLPR